MKLQQLRYLCEVVDQRFNITTAANALFTSQPGVSKQIRMLERELGVDILVRSGNRIVGLSEAGTELVNLARRVLMDSRQLEEVAREFTERDSGQLTLATTHLHARYSLLPVIREFSKKYSNVHLNLLQGSPAEIGIKVSSGEADIGLSTGSDDLAHQCISLTTYPLYRCVVAPLGHPILKKRRLTLRDIAAYPLIVYDPSFSSGSIVLQAFVDNDIALNIVLSATDADVIKAYVAAGLGIAVLQRLAYDPVRDAEIGALGADHLFPVSNAKLIINRAKYLRRYMFDFIQMVAPTWTADRVREALQAEETTQS